jgi:hypothetical protein
MKLKIYFSILTILVLNVNGFCQIDPLRQKLDSIFQYVDKTQIPTGYLKEYGSEFLPLHWFNGLLTDSNTVNSLDIFRTAYCDMVTAKLPTPVINPQARLTLYNTLLPLPQVNNQIDLVTNNSISPIAILYTKYASLKETALSQNLFTVTNQQIYDVPNRTISPYNFNTLFLAAPIKETFTNTVSLRLDTAFFYRNMNVLVTAAFVDFKDGQGFRTLSSTATEKIYTDSSGRKPIVFKITTSDGNILYCNSSVVVQVTNNTASRYLDTDSKMANIEIPVVAADGIGGGDFMQIRYAINNPTRLQAQQHLRKPLIYVEGYDASDIDRVDPNNKGYNIYSLIRNNANNPNDRGEWINLFRNTGYDFMNDLDDIAGYDLVFVNYNTLRSFEDNTKMLQQVLKWVNADKILGAGGTPTQNVVLGVSAGGVLARYTLARLTKFVGVNYADTRLLLTMDSPHQGANVPLSLQHFLYDLGEQTILGNKIKENDKGLQRFIALNNKPATAQLLKARVIDGNGNIALNTFLNGPNSPYQLMVRFDINNPNNVVAPYKFLAVSQGSQCGVPVTSPSVSFASQSAEFALFRFWFPANMWPPLYATSKWWLTSQLNALPNSGTATIEYFKFERRIKFWGIGFGWKTMNEYARPNPAGYVGWDAAPGGTQSITDRTDGGLSTGTQPQPLDGKNWYGFPYASLKAGASLNINQDAFSFVSTTSALDAPFGTDPNTVFNFAANGNLNTSTFRYQAQAKEIGSALYNRNHTDYTPRNARWIYNEMENITQQVTCADQCIQQLAIDSAASFCTTNTYTIPLLPAGASVIWSVTNTSPAFSLTYNVSNSNTFTLTCTRAGSATITATITGNCIATPISLTKNITYALNNDIVYGGTYTINGGAVNNLQPGLSYFIIAPRGATVSANVTAVNNNNPAAILWYGSLSVTVPAYTFTTASQSINSNFTTPCGAVSNIITLSAMSTGGRLAPTDSTITLTATPNPVTDILNISVLHAEKQNIVAREYSVKISELNTFFAVRQMSIKKTGGDFKINMAGLKTGYYAVEINDGQSKQVFKIYKL